jgi:hypothetical protein
MHGPEFGKRYKMRINAGHVRASKKMKKVTVGHTNRHERRQACRRGQTSKGFFLDSLRRVHAPALLLVG